jgi:hypothetical protein
MEDKYGFVYYKELPKRAKKITSVFSFVELDPKEFFYYRTKIGAQYLIYNKRRQIYERYEITPNTRDYQLQKYIDTGRLFLLPSYSQK